MFEQNSKGMHLEESICPKVALEGMAWSSTSFRRNNFEGKLYVDRDSKGRIPFGNASEKQDLV